MRFETWMDKVDQIFVEKTGLDYQSFPDQLYHDMWDDGLSPLDAFNEFVTNEGYGDYLS